MTVRRRPFLAALVVACLAAGAGAQESRPAASPDSRPVVRDDRLSLPSTTPTSQRFKDVMAIVREFEAGKDVPIRGSPKSSAALEAWPQFTFVGRFGGETTHDLPPLGLFDDETIEVVGSHQAAALGLDRGARYWYESADRLLGIDFLGHYGLAIGDVDGDGRDDLAVAMPGGAPNLLLVQQPDGTVVDQARSWGVDILDSTRGLLLVDADNDGDRDLVASIRNATLVFENTGKGSFKREPVLTARTATASEFYSIAAADVDANGLLDFYSVRYVKSAYGLSLPMPYCDARNGPPNHLLKNLGAFRFEDATDASGLGENNDRFSLAASFEDIDDDGDPDLFVANDFGRSNLYINDGGRFRDRIDELGATNIGAGMGVTYGDVDGDGRWDIYVSNMVSAAGRVITTSADFRPDEKPEDRGLFELHTMGNALYRQSAAGRFTKESEPDAGMANGWSWGALFADLDNDGAEDLLIPNGNLSGFEKRDMDWLFWHRVARWSPWKVEPQPAYENGWAALSILMDRGFTWSGRQASLAILGEKHGLMNFGAFGEVGDDPRALALSDWDRDGDLDVWIRNRRAPELRFLRNRTIEPGKPIPADANFLEFELEGRTVNRQAVGARVDLILGDGKKLRRGVRAGEGYLAQSSSTLHFGLGRSTEIREVRVRWPGRKDSSVVVGVAANGRYRIVEGAERAERIKEIPVAARPLTSRPTSRPESAPIDAARDSAERRWSHHATVRLFDRAALPDLRFEASNGMKGSTGGLGGQAFAMVFWSAHAPQSLKALAELRERKDEFRTKKVLVLPVCVDAADDAQAAAAAEAIDPSMPVFRAGPELLDFVDVLQQDVLGRAVDLELPTALTVDRTGLVTAILRGFDLETGFSTAAIDCALSEKGTQKPFSGRVLFPQPRGYGAMAAELRRRGRRDMADFYMAIQRKLTK